MAEPQSQASILKSVQSLAAPSETNASQISIKSINEFIGPIVPPPAVDNSLTIAKPQVWIRLRPLPKFDDNIFEIDDDGTTLRLLIDPKEDKLIERMLNDEILKQNNPQRSLTFKVDGILRNSSQEDAYNSIVNDLVVKAMDGTNGMVIAIGPEVSGKSFTLFGYAKKYEYRGVIPRALEKIFQIIEAKQNEMKFTIKLSIVEVRHNHVKDLLTMGTSELLRIGRNGPKGMCYKDITSMEQGLAILMLALSGQKGIPRVDYAKYHTIIYINIHGEYFVPITLNSGQQQQHFDSRITFTKIASMPTRSNEKNDTTRRTQDQNRQQSKSTENYSSTNRVISSLNTKKLNLTSQPNFEKIKSCCSLKTGEFGEAIEIRRDLFMLEQMFIRTNELRKLNRFYSKVEKLGMLMVMRRPHPAPSQYFRQCKLAHCLQDIVSGTTSVRLILTIRPEKQYLHSTLEAMRFAQKAKHVPVDIELNPKEDNNNSSADVTIEDLIYPGKVKEELLIIREESEIKDRLAMSPAGLSDLQVTRTKPSVNRQRIYEASDFLEGKIDEIKIINKTQVKNMFETIRQIWKFTAAHDWKKKQLQREKEEALEKKKKEEEEALAMAAAEAARLAEEKAENERRESTASAPSHSPTKHVKKKPRSKKAKTKGKSDNQGGVLDARISESGFINDIADQIVNDSKMLETVEEEDEDTDSEIPDKSARKSSAKPPVIQINLRLPRNENQPWTAIDEAWDEFLKIEIGITKFGELKKENKVLLDQFATHDDIIKNIRKVVAKIRALLRAFNGVLEEKSKSTETTTATDHQSHRLSTTATGHHSQRTSVTAPAGTHPVNNNNLSVPADRELLRKIKSLEAGRDELIEKLHVIRIQALEQKKLVNSRKQDCENEFKNFCAAIPEIKFGKNDSIIPLPYSEEFGTAGNANEQEEILKNYEFISKNASKQARQLLRWFYKSKPDWYYYC